jgi:hypothetical protein
MESEFDDFGDILGDNDDGGVFAGSGHKVFEHIKQTVQPGGVQVEMQCRVCGVPRGILVEWPELFVIGTNGPNTPVILPPGWQLSEKNRTAFLSMPCPKCGKPLAVHFTPDEAAKHVSNATRSGLLNTMQVEQIKAYVRQQRGM